MSKMFLDVVGPTAHRMSPSQEEVKRNALFQKPPVLGASVQNSQKLDLKP